MPAIIHRAKQEGFYLAHSIFRFVRGRDDIHYTHHLKTDQADPQWKQALDDCGVKVI